MNLPSPHLMNLPRLHLMNLPRVHHLMNLHRRRLMNLPRPHNQTTFSHLGRHDLSVTATDVNASIQARPVMCLHHVSAVHFVSSYTTVVWAWKIVYVDHGTPCT